MSDPHVISALREKRARLSAIIDRLQRQLDQHRADLAHVDGVLRLFAPETHPALIRPNRTYAKRTRYFAKGELARLCRGDGESETLKIEEVVAQAIAAKGFDAGDLILRAAIRDQILTTLRAFRKRATVEQIGLGRGISGRSCRRDETAITNESP